jgi:hypothetical protein
MSQRTQPVETLPAHNEQSVLEAVREFRRAARIIVGSDRSRRVRLQALIRLGAKARESEAGVLAQQAVWVESKEFIRDEPPPLPIRSGDPVEDAIRAQLQKGHVRCETCRRPLPTEEMLDRARRRRRDEIERRQLFEEAGR